jgi:hypothetical protein
MLHGVGLVAVVVLLAIAFAAVSGRGESPMAARLGEVLYWGASVIAGLLMIGAAFAMVFGMGDDRFLMVGFVTVFAIIVWLVGRACRYVLAGR